MVIAIAYMNSQQKPSLQYLQLPPQTTVKDALQHANVLADFENTQDYTDLELAIFGQSCQLQQQLQDQDRIEILEPLRCDPETARQRRKSLKRKLEISHE
jgi:uncharacterized protein